MRKRIERGISAVFATVLTLCLIAALFVGAGFLSAFIIGGQEAARICAMLNDRILPVIYIIGGTIAILGVVKMYLAGEESFSLKKGRKDDSV